MLYVHIYVYTHTHLFFFQIAYLCLYTWMLYEYCAAHYYFAMLINSICLVFQICTTGQQSDNKSSSEYVSIMTPD